MQHNDFGRKTVLLAVGHFGAEGAFIKTGEASTSAPDSDFSTFNKFPVIVCVAIVRRAVLHVYSQIFKAV